MMTWGQFKKLVEEKGVSDADEIHWIDVSGDMEDLEINVNRKPGGYLEIH